jgi:lytic murein transglycosylase
MAHFSMPFLRRYEAMWLLTGALALPAWGQTEFQQCLSGLRSPAKAAGVKEDSFARFTQDLRPDMGILDKMNNQPEFRMPIWDYLAALVDDERVAEGQAQLVQHRALLDKVAFQYGVDPATVVAVWGVESNFGQTFGKYPLTQALGTLSCFGNRQNYFRGEFYATLRILQAGHMAPERLVGSWAGAFGHTQFMPTTFERLAQDFDGDGRRDLMDSVPDALASTAYFLSKAGWNPAQVWGFEVKLPAGMDVAGEGRKIKRPLSEWAARGLKRVDGSALPHSSDPTGPMTTAGLMTPAGAQGPAFLVFRNFDAIYSYNAAESYGLAIAHLSDRLRGAEPFATPWPTDDGGLSRAQRREVQTLLRARDHDIGEIDGMLGEKSRIAIKAEQARLGQEVNGRAGQKLLRALR